MRLCIAEIQINGNIIVVEINARYSFDGIRIRGQGCKATEYEMWLGQGEYIVVAKFISFSRWINEYFVIIVSLSINRNHGIVHVTTSVCMYYHH
jgi:hypothetical protein